jgi:cell division protein FtsW
MTRTATDARPGAPALDGVLLAAVLALTAVGAVMVYSASAVTAAERLGDQFHYLKRQLVAAGIGLALMGIALRLGHRRVAALAYPILGATLVLLALVPIVGVVAGGARRWLDLGLLRFQPAELAKVALVLYLARSLSRKDGEALRSFGLGFLPHALVTGVLVLLCLLQKDLGTGVVLLVVMFAMLFAAGVRPLHLAGAAALAVPGIWAAIAFSPHRLPRVRCFLNPFSPECRDGAGFQLVESLLGIGNGGWVGQGLGQGKGKLFYLPAAHTDFIAAVVAEETGLLGVSLLVLLFAVVIWRGLRAGARASDAFASHAALGLTVLVGAQALVNLAVVFGLAPTKGLTLPFVSYGGSSLMTLLGAAGVLLSVSGDRGGYLRPAVHAVRIDRAAAEGAP